MGLIPRRNRFCLLWKFLSNTLRKRESEAVLRIRIRDPVPDYRRQLRKLGRASGYICCAALFLYFAALRYFFWAGGGIPWHVITDTLYFAPSPLTQVLGIWIKLLFFVFFTYLQYIRTQLTLIRCLLYTWRIRLLMIHYTKQAEAENTFMFSNKSSPGDNIWWYLPPFIVCI